MLVVVSPAKKLDFQTPSDLAEYETPLFIDEAKLLIKDLKKKSSQDLQKLMGISENLAELNVKRFNTFKPPFTPTNAKQAGLAFQGDTYQGLEFHDFNKSQRNFAQKHLRILSGLYGILRPLDLMQAYRLEMGTKFGAAGASDLYGFWKEKITEKLNEDLKGQKALVNCASNEYFKAVDTKALKAQVVTPIFKEEKNGKLKIISFNAKRARGMMAKFIIENKLKDPNDLKKFNMDNYKFDPELSDETNFTFTR
ncbi:MAG: peroxide stress protein YaaA [Bacteriovoracaceae bacterium]|nr:peroxide stress protein YaaA [Bacteriovoracaceae bacterium]